jgi:hypothetical protein
VSAGERHQDDGEVWDLLKVRKLEIVDDSGRTRIYAHAFTDGAAEVRVNHPDTNIDRIPSGGELVDVVLAAGFDTELGGYGRAGIYIEDGNHHITLDTVRDSIDRAEFTELRQRVRDLEDVLSVLSAAFGGVGNLGPSDIAAAAECPRCHLEFPHDTLAAHVGSEDCDLARAEVQSS